MKGVWPDSYAYAELVLGAAGSLSDLLARILDDLRPVKAALQAFADEGGSAELFVSWHFIANSGDTLDWQLMQQLSECRLGLALDIYPEAQPNTGKGWVH